MESGCVAVVAIITEDCIYTANIGDSRCIVSKGGTALTLSIDHKPEDRDEEDRIQKAGGFISDDGRIQGTINISRAFGKLNIIIQTALLKFVPSCYVTFKLIIRYNKLQNKLTLYLKKILLINFKI